MPTSAASRTCPARSLRSSSRGCPATDPTSTPAVGRTESILTSLPPRVRFVYVDAPPPGSREAALLDVLRTPRERI